VNKFGAITKGVYESRVRLSSYAADNMSCIQGSVTAGKCSSRRVRCAQRTIKKHLKELNGKWGERIDEDARIQMQLKDLRLWEKERHRHGEEATNDAVYLRWSRSA
jgi:hypothetical protein